MVLGNWRENTLEQETDTAEFENLYSVFAQVSRKSHLRTSEL